MQIEFIVVSIFALFVFGIVHMYVSEKKAKEFGEKSF